MNRVDLMSGSRQSEQKPILGSQSSYNSKKFKIRNESIDGKMNRIKTQSHIPISRINSQVS
jgi:hypothetical protein